MSISSFVDRIRQHPGKEQVELKVRIKVPGNVFPGLTPTERAQHYEAQATEFIPAHRFAKAGLRPAETTAAIRYLCTSDVVDDPQHQGFLMRLTDWNRYRNDTFKHDREAELPYIRDPGDGAVAAPAQAEQSSRKRPLIYSEFEQVGAAGVHMQRRRPSSPSSPRSTSTPSSPWPTTPPSRTSSRRR